jgi:SAM-dependent methyltransferase
MRREDWRKFDNLNMGCGNKEYPHCVNIDKNETDITHVLWDLNIVPYPFPDNNFKRVYAQDIIEHLDNVITVVDEVHRLLKVDGEFHIRTAAWDTEQSYTDPTHKHWFTIDSFDFFDPETHWGSRYGWYTKLKWKILFKEFSGEELVFVMRVIK